MEHDAAGPLSGGAGWSLILSTVAGLSTTVGAAIAVTHVPSEASLAFLLGTAIGVMGTVSLLELWVRNALANHALWVTLAVAAGAAAFHAVRPFLPSPPEGDGEDGTWGEVAQLKIRAAEEAEEGVAATASATRLLSGASLSRLQHAASGPAVTVHANCTASPGSPGGQAGGGGSGGGGEGGLAAGKAARHPAKLLRLGLLMAVTMTLHNLPEGFAVAFAAYTDVGPAMALAIAIHNVPEGIIVAAPIYAATGSRRRALLVASASGLSEPLGALAALLLVKPFVTSLGQLDYLLAFVGGIMLAVCGAELWPEARRCRHDARMAQGIALGALVMVATLV